MNASSNIHHYDSALHFALQVARAGRFGTKGLAITFVSEEGDAKVLNDVQERFEVNITELPEEIDVASYCEYSVSNWFMRAFWPPYYEMSPKYIKNIPQNFTSHGFSFFSVEGR